MKDRIAFREWSWRGRVFQKEQYVGLSRRQMGPQGKRLEFVPCGPVPRTEYQDNWERRLGPAQIEDKRPHLPHSLSQETSPTTHAQKGFLEVTRGVTLSGEIYPQASSVASTLAKGCMRTRGNILRHTKRGVWTRQSKMIVQRKHGRNAP